jgi:hypothetical protein
MNGYFTLRDMVLISSARRPAIAFQLNTALLGNTHSLIDFIATCKDYTREQNAKWNVHLKDNPQVSFKAGENYSIYFDNSETVSLSLSSNQPFSKYLFDSCQVWDCSG